MSKTYVLDTNVLLHSPHALFTFSEHTIVIPEVVLEELDRFKSESNDRGANSREVSRIIDQLRARGNLVEGVPLNEDGGVLRIAINHLETPMPTHWDRFKADNRILQVCRGLAQEGREVVLVSRDTNMRVKADILDIAAEDFRNEKVAKIEDQYTGRADVCADAETIRRFNSDIAQCLAVEDVRIYDAATQAMVTPVLTTNQFLHIRSRDDDRTSALGRFDGEKIIRLKYQDHNPFGVTPRNIGQIFMQESLLLSAEEAPLVIIKGPAGTAKTFYSLAVGLHRFMDCRPRDYHHLLICRPNVPMDEDLGYLPGSEQEKIDPYMRAVRDNLFTLMS